MSAQTELKKLSIIRRMAEIRLTGDLQKNNYSDYAKVKAIDVLFDCLRRAYKNESPETVLANIKESIANFLKHESTYFGNTTLDKVEEFVRLFQELVDTEYSGRVRIAYRNRFNIRSAYLWEMDVVLRDLSDKKKLKQKESEQKKKAGDK